MRKSVSKCIKVRQSVYAVFLHIYAVTQFFFITEIFVYLRNFFLFLTHIFCINNAYHYLRYNTSFILRYDALFSVVEYYLYKVV